MELEPEPVKKKYLEPEPEPEPVKKGPAPQHCVLRSTTVRYSREGCPPREGQTGTVYTAPLLGTAERGVLLERARQVQCTQHHC